MPTLNINYDTELKKKIKKCFLIEKQNVLDIRKHQTNNKNYVWCKPIMNKKITQKKDNNIKWKKKKRLKLLINHKTNYNKKRLKNMKKKYLTITFYLNKLSAALIL